MQRPHVVQVWLGDCWKVAGTGKANQAADLARLCEHRGSKARVLSPEKFTSYLRDLRNGNLIPRTAAERLETPRRAAQSELGWRPSMLVG